MPLYFVYASKMATLLQLLTTIVAALAATVTLSENSPLPMREENDTTNWNGIPAFLTDT
jgi:hypothetical protein